MNAFKPIKRSHDQKELFPTRWVTTDGKAGKQLPLSNRTLKQWQEDLENHQKPLFKGEQENSAQQSLLFEASPSKEVNFIDAAQKLNPLDLRPLPISFWRSPKTHHDGAAIYLVMDSPKRLSSPILLYIGETIVANKRWKGDHDCKTYLSAYAEALSQAKIEFNLSIRFWTDVPSSTKSRRAIEQLLIQKWSPPFNKETRGRWSTPFTAEFR